MADDPLQQFKTLMAAESKKLQEQFSGLLDSTIGGLNIDRRFTDIVDQFKRDINEKIQQLTIPFTSLNLDDFTQEVLKLNVIKIIPYNVPGASAATAANYGNIFVADRSYEVIGFSEVHDVVGSNGSPVTLDLEKCTSGTAPDSGVTLLKTALSLKATARTPQFGTLTDTKVNLILSRGDRLVLKDSGTLTAVSDVAGCVILLEK